MLASASGATSLADYETHHGKLEILPRQQVRMGWSEFPSPIRKGSGAKVRLKANLHPLSAWLSRRQRYLGIWSLEFGISSLQSLYANYDYVCEKCGHQFEMVNPCLPSHDHLPGRTFAASALGKAKSNGRLAGGAGLIFKGSGFKHH